jgi:hypothetical protein
MLLDGRVLTCPLEQGLRAEFLLHVLRLRGRMEQEEEEVVMEFTDSEPDE